MEGEVQGGGAADRQEERDRLGGAAAAFANVAHEEATSLV